MCLNLHPLTLKKFVVFSKRFPTYFYLLFFGRSSLVRIWEWRKCYCKNKCVVLKLYDYISIYDVKIKIINRGSAIYAINYLSPVELQRCEVKFHKLLIFKFTPGCGGMNQQFKISTRSDEGQLVRRWFGCYKEVYFIIASQLWGQTGQCVLTFIRWH